MCRLTGTGFGPGFLPGPGWAGVLGVERLWRLTGTVFAMAYSSARPTIPERAFASSEAVSPGRSDSGSRTRSHGSRAVVYLMASKLPGLQDHSCLKRPG